MVVLIWNSSPAFLAITIPCSALSKALGKQAFYAQVGLDQSDAYAHAIEAMASAAMLDDAQEGFRAFLEKRRPNFTQRA